jgi:hypothetical protein
MNTYCLPSRLASLLNRHRSFEVMTMSPKIPRPPPTQRRFGSPWVELDYLCKRIHYWLYARKHRTNANHYAPRLVRVLRNLPDDNVAIVRQEALALVHELEGDLDAAISHREREIQLTERLHKIAHAPDTAESTRRYMLQRRDAAALRERREILEALQHQKCMQHRAVPVAS